jgi:hypothetical protein
MSFTWSRIEKRHASINEEELKVTMIIEISISTLSPLPWGERMKVREKGQSLPHPNPLPDKGEGDILNYLRKVLKI